VVVDKVVSEFFGAFKSGPATGRVLTLDGTLQKQVVFNVASQVGAISIQDELAHTTCRAELWIP
jgi:hypothetical protein